MSGIEARDIIEAELRRELFGPLESDLEGSGFFGPFVLRGLF